MPTYPYACTDCGHQFEIFQSFSDDALTECPECHGKLRKVFGSVGVVFKGSGFYRTDNRADNRSGSSSKSTAPSESAPAAKSDSASGASSSSSSSSSTSSSSTTSGAA